MMEKYFGFRDRVDVAAQFEEGIGSRYQWSDEPPFVPNADFPTEEEILFASYDTDDYPGDAFVLFERGGVLFEVNGSHCSCYGLEGQWKPEETSWAALALRVPNKDHWKLCE